MLVDHLGFLQHGRLVLSDSMDAIRARFRYVEVTVDGGVDPSPSPLPSDWLAVERAGNRLTFLTSAGDRAADALGGLFPAGAHIAVRPATLKEVYVGLSRHGDQTPRSLVEVSS
jgi:hypothetical protein